MPISWNEIRQNAIAFSREWQNESREEAEAKSFWDGFFAVFGIKRRTIASFEEPVKKLSGSWGFIDLFWPGTLLVEHKTKGKSLDKAESQAMEYIHGLKNEGRDDEIPRYIVVSDFDRIVLHDLEDEGKTERFPLKEFYKHIHAFAFIPGYQQHTLAAEDPINIRAVEIMGKLHDALEEGGYSGHALEQFLVRILFCLFADYTGIFERNSFTLYLQNHTKEDGSDLGPHLERIFQVLNTPSENRQRNLVEELAELPYVNGDLFAEHLGFADFNRAMRDQLMRCTRFDWSRISPAVFGSLFQSVMEPKERRQVGAHYTSERDILKLVRSLFLDELQAEFEKIKSNKRKLKEFHAKLGKLTFFDPACGCGNFLIVTYRELRLLEIEVMKILFRNHRTLNLELNAQIDVDAMYGIEIKEFPARIAEVAILLVDHQMNQLLSESFGIYYVRLPLKKNAKIAYANALRMEWKDLLPPEKCSYLLGNPPFVGAKYQTPEQREDMRIAAGNVQNSGLLDYVTAWYFKAAEYIKGTTIQAAFVSTNSISQGEQVGLLWGELFRRGIYIQFAHRTFTWQSEARGKAHVHVVIIGFSAVPMPNKRIYDYENDAEHPTVTPASNISPYLLEGPNIAIVNRSKPICDVPEISFGSMPNDDGNLLFSDQQKADFIRSEPKSRSLFRQILGSIEFINGLSRWCLWLKDISPSELRGMPRILERLELIRESRLRSTRPKTKDLAQTPFLFGEDRQPIRDYLAIPKTSSEKRRYIPIAFLSRKVIANSELFTIQDARMYEFGILTSRIMMIWVKVVCGRLKSDYRFSAKLVYNNYPWPENPTEKQKAKVEAKAQAVLDARSAFPDASLADLYDPLSMPAPLAKAHAELDRAVELCYRPKPFTNDRERVEFLFRLYEKLTSPLTAATDDRSA